MPIRLAVLLSLTIALATPTFGQGSCTLGALQGPYALQLSGDTTITGEPKPVSALGRIVLDGSGVMTGYSTVMFGGFLLRNPVTGTYDTKPDCTVTWALQDDSGAFQHFGGTFTPDGRRIEFRQTDPGGAEQGLMEKTRDDCKPVDLQKSYDFSLSGSSFPMAAGQVASSIAIKGAMAADVNGNFKLTVKGQASAPADVALKLENDCTMELGFAVPIESGGTGTTMNMRGILVDGGKGILAMQTDPGWMVAGKFTAH
jgi:hypothetical protein